MMGMVEAPQISDTGTRTNRRPLVRVIGELCYCKDPIQCSLAKATTHGTLSLCNFSDWFEK